MNEIADLKNAKHELLFNVRHSIRYHGAANATSVIFDIKPFDFSVL